MTVVRIGPVSGRVRWRHLVVPVAATAVLVLLSAVSLGRGDFPIGIVDVLRTLVGLGEGAQDFIVLDLRAPRIVVGLLVGLALGVAGQITVGSCASLTVTVKLSCLALLGALLAEAAWR